MLLALNRLEEKARAASLPYPILFVTQVPVPGDFTSINSVFGNHQAGLEAASRGGDLYILLWGHVEVQKDDVPVATLSGEPGPDAALVCILFGTTTAFTPERIADLYPSRADYEQRYAASADTVIDQGFVLPVDRDRLLDYADPSAVAP